MLLLITLFSILNFAIAEPTPLCAKDGQVISDDNIYKIALVGNTRPTNLRKDTAALRMGASEGVTTTILENIVGKKPDCISFVGDMVRSGNKREWKKFQSEQLQKTAGIPILPVVGNLESASDGKYINFNQTFGFIFCYRI